MESEKDMCKTLYSILLLGGNMTSTEIEKDYEELTYSKCAYTKFGCKNISEFLNKFMNDKIKFTYNGGCLFYSAIGSSKVEHVTDLIDRTKMNKKKKLEKKNSFDHNCMKKNSYNVPKNYNSTKAKNVIPISKGTSPVYFNTKSIPLSSKPSPAFSHTNIKYVSVSSKIVSASNKNISYVPISTETSTVSSNIKYAPSFPKKKISSSTFLSSYKYTGNSFHENIENKIDHPFMKSDGDKQKEVNRKVAFDKETSSLKITVVCKPTSTKLCNNSLSKPPAITNEKLPATDEKDSILLSIQQNLHNIRLGLENSKSKTNNSIFHYP